MTEAAARIAAANHRLLEALSALRHRNYRLYWLGQLSSVLAQNMEGVAQAWLVLELTDSPLMLGAAGLAFAAPTILLTLLGGVIADRADRRRIMIVSQTVSAAVFASVGTLVAVGRIALWHVLLFAFVSGSVRAFDRPSRMALLPQMVPRSEIPNAVAIGGTIWQLNRLMGPAVAGMLIYWVGVGPTYYFCLAASLSAVALWLAIRLERRPAAAVSGGLVQNMVAGLSFIRQNQIYSTFIGMAFFNSAFGMSYLVLMPVFARNVLEVGSRGFGFLQSAGGAGALCGVLLVAFFATARRKGLMAIGGALLFGWLLIVFALSRSYPLSLALAFALGAASQFYITTINSILQVNLPDHLRGRVMGIYGLAWELMPVGGMIAGAIAEYAGAPAAVAIGGAAVGAMALVVAARRPEMRRLE
ncbi:MAG TPA: MFS transporter [candidate division Zixibacteria bacterium]|nr:MFS transporter [candidate division Zixibacteria bacterium]